MGRYELSDFEWAAIHEAHRRPGHGLADRLGIGGIVLLPLHIWLHIARRYALHLVTQRTELEGSMVRRQHDHGDSLQRPAAASNRPSLRRRFSLPRPPESG